MVIMFNSIKITAMKKITYLLLSLFVVFLIGCKDDELPLPNDVTNLTVAPRIGGAVVKWKFPADTAMKYLQVRYTKNNKVIIKNASTYSDSCLITGLLNKFDYTFEVQSFNADNVGGKILSVGPVKPIRRSSDTTYTYAEIPLTAAMLTTFTQESSEGPKTNLVDGNLTTYWHTAWSAGVAPLPHWIQINFASDVLFGGFKYWMRNPSSSGGRPSQWDVQTSPDGNVWNTIWTSAPGLAVDPVGSEYQQLITKPVLSKFIKVRIIATPGNTTYTHLGEFKALGATLVIINREKEAEDNY
jgi:hypothetical protein